MTIMPIKLSVVIPAYNEERRIAKTLSAISSYLEKQDFSWEIIVVDDGSKDTTVQIVNDLHLPSLRLIKLGQNQGKGAAVKKGMLSAEGEYRLFCDADNATPIGQLEKMWLMTDKFPVVIGSRYLKGSRIVIEQTFMRRFLSRIGNILIQVMILPGFPDTQCGFKLFEGKAAQAIFTKQTISRWGFDMEVLFIARKLKFKIGQVPVDWYDRAGSKIHSSNVFVRTLSELFKIRWNGLTGKYRS